jgi:predicted lactoylglutathione lyase
MRELMSTKIFVNLPVKDLGKLIDFFTELGFSFNPQFTDDNATCMVISDDIYAMLLMEPFFKSFTNKEIVDATKSTEVILALGVDSRQRVDELVDKALAARRAIRELFKRRGLHVRTKFPGRRRAPMGSAVHGPDGGAGAGLIPLLQYSWCTACSAG